MRTTDNTALLHLLHLVSPALPVGAYAYSQGLETAVEQGWVNNRESAREWIANIMLHSLGRLDVPVLLRTYEAWRGQDWRAIKCLNDLLQASRESKELLLEDVQMGQALIRLLSELGLPQAKQWSFTDDNEQPCFVIMFALAAQHWQIARDDTARGFIWSWLENQVASAIKLVPLGQTQAQALLLELMPVIDDTLQLAQTIGDDEIGSGLPRLAMASMQHEVQYSRLFRS